MSHISKYGSFISRVLLVPFLLISLSLIQACGLPGEAGGTSGTSNDDVGSGPAQDSTGEPARFKGLILNAERLNGQTELSGNITFTAVDINGKESDFSIPNHNIEYSKLADNTLLRIIETDYIESVNHVIKVSYGSGEAYYTFIPPTETVDNDTRVSEQVTANIYSHYAVLKFVEILETVEELDALRPCGSGAELINCIKQPKAKQTLMHNLANLAAGFDFDFGESPSVASALGQLEAHAEFNQLVTRSINEIIITTEEAEAIVLGLEASEQGSLGATDIDPAPIGRGTFRSTALGTDLQGTQLNFNTTISETYNSVYFNIGIGSLTNDLLTTISATASTIVNNGDTSTTPPDYPRYYKNNTMANMRYESALTVDIPFAQQSISMGGLNETSSTIELDRSVPTNNIKSSETFDSFITTQGNILDSRVYLQTVLGETGDAEADGLTLSPTYSKMYSANEYEPDAAITSIDSNDEEIDYGNEPTWLTSSNINQATKSLIANYRLDNQTVTDTETRKLFSWEVHGLETDTDFAIADLDGKQYGAISFGIKLNNTGKIVELIGDLMSWSVSGRNITSSQPESADGFYMSHYLSLNQNGSVNTLSSDRSTARGSRLINARESISANTDHSGGVTAENRGLLVLDDGSERPIGHTTQSGDYLAFAFNTTDIEASNDRGTGIILASTAIEDTPSFGIGSQLIYQIQGNTISIEEGTNTFRNLNGSTLTISGAESSAPCSATLNIESISLSQTIDEEQSEVTETVFESESAPLNRDREYTYNSTTCAVANNTILMEFENVHGQDLTVKGFISKSGGADSTKRADMPGNLLSLLWVQQNSLGLLLGHKEQHICPHFDGQISTTTDPRCPVQ